MGVWLLEAQKDNGLSDFSLYGITEFSKGESVATLTQIIFSLRQ